MVTITLNQFIISISNMSFRFAIIALVFAFAAASCYMFSEGNRDYAEPLADKVLMLGFCNPFGKESTTFQVYDGTRGQAFALDCSGWFNFGFHRYFVGTQGTVSVLGNGSLVYLFM